MATTNVMPIRLRGSPRIVEGLAPFPPQEMLTASLTFDLKVPQAGKQAAFTLETDPVGASATRLKFSLPESTPPGTYEGTAQIGGESYPIKVEVEPYPYLVISPRQLLLQIRPGADTTVDLTLVNSGNVPCEITKTHAFGIFDVKGVENSIGTALRDSKEKGQGRLNRLIDEVADHHGGLVRVTINEGVGVIKPGEFRNLRATLRLSDRLKPGYTYWGTWPLFNLKYYVRVYVENQESKPPKGESA